MASSPTSPLSSDGWSPPMSPTSPISRLSSNRGSPRSPNGSKKNKDKAWEMWSPPKGNFNDVIQGEALVHGADELHNKRGSGMIILTQNGRHFYLDFLNLKVRNVQDRTLRVYLLKKKKAKGKKDADSLETRVKKKKAYMLDLDLGEDGALVGDKVVGVSHFQQPLGTALKGVGGVSPLDWVGIIFAKPSTETPRTPSADVYAFANIGPPPEYDVEDEQKVSAQVAVEEKRVLDMMMGQARGSLTLRDVKRKADAVFRNQGKDNRTDDLTYSEFCKGMKYLGIHLTEARSRKIFRTADLDNGGTIDCSEFEMAVHIDDKINVKERMTPLDAFDIFDENFRGGVDAIEFYKLMMALDVSITMEQSMAEFNAADGDHSGILDYDEFRTIWLRYCDVESELIKRNVAPASEHRVKKAKKRAQMDLEALRKLVEKEEADEKAIFEKAKKECIEERRTQRRAKSERASKRRGERTREANIARREKAKLEREKKSRASIRRREAMRRQRVEAELLDELAKQRVVRKERELVELHAKRQSRALEEEKEREAKGEHEVSMMGRGLRVVPNFLYKARAAQLRLNTLQLLDMSSNKLVALPETGCFFHMASLRKLDISHNRLQTLPTEISECTELLILNAQDNDLVELPAKLTTGCRNLRKINLSENELLRLPEDVGNLARLESLLLFRNQLQILPESLGLLDNLHTLDVSVNHLTALPYSIGGCSQLTALNVSWNRVEVIPQSLGVGLHKLLTLNASNNIVHFLPTDMSGLTSLESFDMTFNELISLPESLPMMTNLKSLAISNNRVNVLPKNFGDMRLMTKVLMRNNMLEALPATIGYLRRLKVLDFAKNNIKTLPPEMGALLALTHIDGSFNEISGCWPAELGCVPELQSCIFTHNKIEELPFTVGGLTTLTLLNFSNNCLRHVPESIGNMLSLTNLNLSCNKLVALPERIGDAQALQHLDLSANQLIAVPRTIGWLRCIRSLSVFNNRLASLPAEFGTLIQRLESFSCGRNPFSDLDTKWSTTWTNADKYSTVFTSGYTEGEAADWALEAQAWYPDAYEVWQRMFSNKWAKADIGDFMRVLRVKMGDDWRTRFEPKVRSFYFKAKHNLGYAQRYDQLAATEQTEKQEAHARAKKWHAEKIPRLRKEAREIRVRKQASYIFDEREIIRRMKAYRKDKEERNENEKQEWLKGLRELSKVLHDRQEHRMRKREFTKQQAKAREQRLLKTAARARALRASRKAHAGALGGGDSGTGMTRKKSLGPSTMMDSSDDEGLPMPPVTR